MAPLSPIKLASQTYESSSAAVSQELLENLYVEANPVDRAPSVLHGTPGLKLELTVGSGPIRGMYASKGRLYVVSGSELYAVEPDYSTLLVKGDMPGTDAVRAVDGLGSGNPVVLFLAGGRAFTVDTTDNSVVELDPDQGPFSGVAYQDGIAVLTQTGTEGMVNTTVDDLNTISDFSAADTFPDKIVGLISDHRELWIFGDTTTEVWQNAGLPDFPFARAGAGFMERGCASGATIAKAENNVFWLGDNLRVYTANSYQPVAISTPAIEFSIKSSASPKTATAFVYSQRGHTFYVLSFTDKTLVFDVTTGRWHTRVSDTLNRWRVSTYVTAFDLDLVGDYSTGKIYALDFDTYDEDGAILRRRMVTPPLFANNSRILMEELRIDLESGVGLVSGQGSDPIVIVEWTDDQGHNWSNGIHRSMGKIGEYNRQAKLYNLGSFRNQRSIRFTISDPVKTVIIGASARLEALDA